MSKLKDAFLEAKEKYECIKFEECEDDGFIRGQNYLCTLKNGKVINRSKIIKHGGDASASIIIPVTKNNEVILTIQPRVFTDDTVEVSFPGGLVDEGEDDMLECARRELLEETGVEAEVIEPLGVVYINSANSAGKHYYYLARNASITKEQELDEDEFIDVVTVPVEEAFEWLKEDRAFPSTFFIGMSYLKEKLVKED